jgi:hypothetical protein
MPPKSKKSSSTDKICEKDEDCGTTKKCLKPFLQARTGKCVNNVEMEKHKKDEEVISESLKNKTQQNQKLMINLGKIRNLPKSEEDKISKIKQKNKELKQQIEEQDTIRVNAEKAIKTRFEKHNIQHPDNMSSCPLCQEKIPENEIDEDIGKKILLKTHCCRTIMHVNCARTHWNNIDFSRWKQCPTCRNSPLWVKLINETDERDPNLSAKETKDIIKDNNSRRLQDESIPQPVATTSSQSGPFHPYTNELNNQPIVGFENQTTSPMNIKTFGSRTKVYYSENQGLYIMGVIRFRNVNSAYIMQTTWDINNFTSIDDEDGIEDYSDACEVISYERLIRDLEEYDVEDSTLTRDIDGSVESRIATMKGDRNMVRRRAYIFREGGEMWDGETHMYLGNIVNDNINDIVNFIYPHIYMRYYSSSGGKARSMKKYIKTKRRKTRKRTKKSN